MKLDFPKNSAAYLAILLVFLPVFWFLFQILPDNGINFWNMVERLSQWKPAVLKGWSFIALFVFFLTLLGLFIFVSKKELDE